MVVIFMFDDMWKKFLTTGSVQDYLNYKNSENLDDEFSRIEITNANYNQRFNNQGTNDRRE